MLQDTAKLKPIQSCPSPSPSPKPQKPPTKKKFEKIWKLIFLLITTIFLAISNKIYQFHTREQFSQHKKGNLWELLLISVPFGVIYVAVDYFLHFLFDQWTEREYLREDRYIGVQARKRRSFTLVRWLYNIIYYTWSSITAYLLILPTSYTPTWLGGSGSIYTLLDNRYLEQSTETMKLFYCIQMGKHLGRYFSHTFLRPQGSYYEYVLHHSLSTFLIFFSYAMNMWTIGVFVLFVHDVSDVFLALARGYNQYKHRIGWLKNVCYLLGFSSWVVFRVLIFSYCCVYAIWYQCLYHFHILNEAELQIFRLPYYFMTFMLSCLLLMHVYWTYYIVESFVAISVSEKLANHTYD